MYRTIISFQTLFCFLLFVSPFVEFVIPGGDMYTLACVVGVVAFVGVGLEAKGRQNTFCRHYCRCSLFDLLGYAVIRMPLPVDMALCIKLVAVTGIWCYCRLNVTPSCENNGYMVDDSGRLGAVCHRTATRLWGVKELPFRVCFDRNVWKSSPFGGYLSVVIALLFSYVLQENCLSQYRGACSCALWSFLWRWCYQTLGPPGVRLVLPSFCFLTLKYLSGKRIMRFGGFVLFAMGFPAVGMLLYGYRPDSADARILVWRVCGKLSPSILLWESVQEDSQHIICRRRPNTL